MYADRVSCWCQNNRGVEYLSVEKEEPDMIAIRGTVRNTK